MQVIAGLNPVAKCGDHFHFNLITIGWDEAYGPASVRQQWIVFWRLWRIWNRKTREQRELLAIFPPDSLYGYWARRLINLEGQQNTGIASSAVQQMYWTRLGKRDVVRRAAQRKYAAAPLPDSRVGVDECLDRLSSCGYELLTMSRATYHFLSGRRNPDPVSFEPRIGGVLVEFCEMPFKEVGVA